MVEQPRQLNGQVSSVNGCRVDSLPMPDQYGTHPRQAHRSEIESIHRGGGRCSSSHWYGFQPGSVQFGLRSRHIFWPSEVPWSTTRARVELHGFRPGFVRCMDRRASPLVHMCSRHAPIHSPCPSHRVARNRCRPRFGSGGIETSEVGVIASLINLGGSPCTFR